MIWIYLSLWLNSFIPQEIVSFGLPISFSFIMDKNQPKKLCYYWALKISLQFADFKNITYAVSTTFHFLNIYIIILTCEYINIMILTFNAFFSCSVIELKDIKQKIWWSLNKGRWKPLMLQNLIILSNWILSSEYLRSSTLGCKDIGTRKS